MSATSKTTLNPVTVLLVDDFTVVTDGLAAIINDEPDLRVVGRAESVKEAIAAVDRLDPDVVLLDYRLPDGTGADAASVIRQRHPGVAIIFLSRFEGDVMKLAAYEAGAAGYLSKTHAAAEVVDAIRRVAKHEAVVSARDVAELFALRHQTTVLMEKLTKRELELLSLMARGYDSHRIAGQLNLRYSTVRSHVRNVLTKMEVHSQLEAVARAVELGLVPPTSLSGPDGR